MGVFVSQLKQPVNTALSGQAEGFIFIAELKLDGIKYKICL